MSANASILEEALALMNDNGKHWVKRTYGAIRKNEPCYCAVGAIRQVLWGSHDSIKPFPWSIREALLEAIDNNNKRKNKKKYLSIEQWNDSPFTKWEDVVKVFTEAIEEERRNCV